jgi:hypothetical protein
MNVPRPRVSLGDGWNWLPTISTDTETAITACSNIVTSSLPGSLPDERQATATYLSWLVDFSRHNGWQQVQVLVGGEPQELVVACFAATSIAVAGLSASTPLAELTALAVAGDPDLIGEPTVHACTINGLESVRVQAFRRLDNEATGPIWEVVTYVVPDREPGRATIMHGMSQSIVHGEALGQAYDAIAATLTAAATRGAAPATDQP